MRKRVSVIGAATAGLIAAKRLASYGIDTSVYDQKVRLGHPVRASGILSISGLSTLDINYSSGITNTLYGANIHAGGKIMTIASRKPVAHILDRRKLNEICWDEAVAAGADVVTGRRISGSELERMSGSDVIIGADGAVSTVAKHFGLGEIGRFILTYKADFNVNVPDPKMVDLFFDNVRYRGLFAWLAPNASDILEVGVGVDASAGNAKAAFERFLNDPGIRDLVKDRKPISEGACIIPMSMRRRFVDDQKGVLLVGDAAGHVKPTTGGGIIFGSNASMMAADSINEYFEGRGMLSAYEARFRKVYGFDLQLHSAINRLYTSLSPRSIGIIIRAMKTLGIDDFLGVYGDMDRPSLVMKRFFLRSLA